MDKVAFQKIIFLPVCQFASPQKVFPIISSKGVFDPLITMVPSVFRQNVPFGRYKHFCTKITMLPNTMKIEPWVPQAMDIPMPPTFGRIDALRESSVEITKSPIPPNTMKIESWVPLGMDVLTALTFGRSDAQILISVEVYMLHLCAFGTTQCYILAKSNPPSS